MNIDKLDQPLSDAGFLLAQFKDIEQIHSEEARLSAISALLDWEQAGPGGYYDNFAPKSAGGAEAGHLNQGEGPRTDPACYFR